MGQASDVFSLPGWSCRSIVIAIIAESNGFARAKESLSWRIRDRKLAADPSCQKVGNLYMARNGLSVTGLRILPKRVLLPLSPQHTTVPAKVAQERFALHPTALYLSNDDEFLNGIGR